MKFLRTVIPIFVVAVFAACSDKVAEQPQSDTKSVYIIGASLAYSENTWFEMGCESVGLTPINRAISGTRPTESAVQMSRGEEYSFEELDSFDVFAIMHCHEMEVCDERKLLDDYHDYEVQIDMDYSQAFDCIIRRYIDDCRALEYNPASKWYGIEGGKPVKIILCTHWHDARVVYNASVRRLVRRWREYATLCPFDKNIGFTKDVPDKNGKQVSLRFARNGINDTEELYGVIYGWHPTRGRDAEIQQRMARIFANALQRCLDDGENDVQ
ncbi:MAG: DUF5040 domain-containing protein [Alistipes sp.]